MFRFQVYWVIYISNDSTYGVVTNLNLNFNIFIYKGYTMITDRFIDSQMALSPRSNIAVTTLTPEYNRKVYYINFTTMDVYVVDRSNTCTLLKGHGPESPDNTGLKVRIEREFTQEAAMSYKKFLDDKSLNVELNQDELVDLDKLHQSIEHGYRTVRLNKIIEVNLSELNENGFFYHKEIDVCFYSSGYVGHKVFATTDSNTPVTISKVVEEQEFYGTGHLFIIDNEHNYNTVFSKMFNRIIKFPIIRDPVSNSGIYLRINNDNKIVNNEVLEYTKVTYKGIDYEYYPLELMNELGLYSTQIEAKNTEKVTHSDMLELERLRADNNKTQLVISNLRAELERAKTESAKQLEEQKQATIKAQAELTKVMADSKATQAQMAIDHKQAMNELETELKAANAIIEVSKNKDKMLVNKTNSMLSIMVNESKANNDLSKHILENVRDKIETRKKAVEYKATLNKLKHEDRRLEYLNALDKERQTREYILRKLKLDAEIVAAERGDVYSDIEAASDASKAGLGLLSLIKAGAGFII